MSNDGEMCGLIGRNGAGKTTLMRALMGALPATRQGRRSTASTCWRCRRIAASASASATCRKTAGWFPRFTVEENILLPAWIDEAPTGAEERLDVDIRDHAGGAAIPRSRARCELSGGQQKMVALARALMAGRAHAAAR